jgi:hypothetical protein
MLPFPVVEDLDVFKGDRLDFQGFITWNAYLTIPHKLRVN